MGRQAGILEAVVHRGCQHTAAGGHPSGFELVARAQAHRKAAQATQAADLGRQRGDDHLAIPEDGSHHARATQAAQVLSAVDVKHRDLGAAGVDLARDAAASEIFDLLTSAGPRVDQPNDQPIRAGHDRVMAAWHEPGPQWGRASKPQARVAAVVTDFEDVRAV
ncbi:hypothetical protein OY671_010083, partial [Metschnikowia pulcherrima]